MPGGPGYSFQMFVHNWNPYNRKPHISVDEFIKSSRIRQDKQGRSGRARPQTVGRVAWSHSPPCRRSHLATSKSILYTLNLGSRPLSKYATQHYLTALAQLSRLFKEVYFYLFVVYFTLSQHVEWQDDILSRVRVTIDGVWNGEWIYWTL
jgi:hypothetical protein